jgi:hypothetical protein
MLQRADFDGQIKKCCDDGPLIARFAVRGRGMRRSAKGSEPQ